MSVQTPLFPLHPSQSEIYYDQQIDEKSPHQNLGGYIIIRGALDTVRLAKAVSSLHQDIDAFRIRIVNDGSRPFLRITAKDKSMPLELVDFSGSELPEADASQWVQTRFNHPYDLYNDILWEHRLLKIGAHEHWYYFKAHHLIIDAYGAINLMKYVARKYNLRESMEEAAEEAVLPPYISEISAVLDYFNTEPYKKAAAYWKEKFALVREPLIRAHRREAEKNRPSGERIIFTLPGGLSTDIKEICKKYKVSLQHMLVAALVVYYHKISGRTNFIFGIPVHSRENKTQSDIIGMFTKSIPFVFDLPGDTTLKALLYDIRVKLLEDYRHFKYPGTHLRNEIKSLGYSGGKNLFEIVVNHLFFHTDNLLNDLECEMAEVISQYPSIPLEFCWQDHGLNKPLKLRVDFRYDYFSAEQLRAFVQRLLFIMEQFAAAMDKKIDLISIVTETELQQLDGYNNTRAEYPSHKTVSTLFEEQVGRSGASVALADNLRELTYKELNERSNRLAHYLRKQGVKEGDLVPLCASRSTDMVAGLLGILKAGGVYVAIDPEYPKDRIEYILQDIQAGILLSDHAVAYRPDPERQLEVVWIDDYAAYEHESENNPNINNISGQIACIIYTSGSTGKPKGVQLFHKGIVNRLFWMWNTYPFRPDEVAALKTSIGFVDHIWELFGPLNQGIPSVLFTKKEVLDPDLFIEKVSAKKITRLVLVPSLLSALLGRLEHNKSRLNTVRYWSCSGEVLPQALIEAFYKVFPVASHTLLNIYGSTEVTADVTCYDTAAGTLHRGGEARKSEHAIGKPIANTRIYILNDGQILLPPGETGEIYVAGDQLAKGYLNLEALTGERFIANPFSTDPSAKLFKTGDSGRWLPDGNLEYRGRKDDQVKIRGNRVETGEVESVIRLSGLAEQVVVAAKEDASGNTRLIAYVVPKGKLNKEDMMKYLESKLPEYMVPSIIVELTEIPLTSSGKVDKNALPYPDASTLLTNTYVEPSGETELSLSRIWKEVLGVERVGATDNFFKLGGDSIIAIQIISRAKKEGYSLRPKDLYAHPTIARLSGFISKGQQKASLVSPEIPADESWQNLLLKEVKVEELEAFLEVKNNGVLHRETIESIYRLSGTQEGILFHSLYEENTEAYIIQLISDLEDLDVEAFRKSWQHIIKGHTILRSAFHHDAFSIPVQSVSKHTDAPLLFLDLRDLGADEKDQKVRDCEDSDRHTRFDLKNPPLMRITLIRLSERKYRMLWTFHHLILDGWSMAVLVEKLLTCYQAFKEGREVKEPSSDPFRDYIQYLGQRNTKQEAAYWKEYLKGKEGGSLLPFISSTTERNKGAGTYKEALLKIDPVLRTRLESYSGNHRLTLNTILQGVWAYLLYCYSVQPDVTFGVTVSGRPDELPGIEERVGMYINTLPFRTILHNDINLADWLQSLQQRQLASREYQYTPINKIQEWTGVKGDLFDSLFVAENYPVSQKIFSPEEGLKLGGIRVYDRTNYPLTLSVRAFDAIEILFSYNSGILNEKYVRQILHHFEYVLEQFVDEGNSTLRDIRLLSEAERYQLLEEFNNTKAEYPKDKTLIGLFEEQVALHPGAIAVEFEDRSLSYQTLNEKANQLAYYLRKHYQIKPDDLIAIVADRSERMVIGLLAILKSGGAYVPIDPSYPFERIRYLIEDSSAKLVLTDIEEYKPDTNVPLVDLGEVLEEVKEYPAENPESINKVTDLAYVIYTSGSTGMPKGAMLEHAGVVNRIDWMWKHYGFEPSDVVFQKTPYVFDVSVWEFFMTLCYGARLVLCRKEVVPDPEAIVAHIEKYGITTLHFVPSMFNVFLDALSAADAARLKTLKRIFASGEALLPETVRKSYSKLPVPLHNLYGPTEASVDVSYYGTSADDKVIPIGKPISNIMLYVLDPALQPVPIGVEGEICIAGIGLARGYLNKEALTKEKFVDHPFRRGMKLYRTGDIGKWLEDGNIEFTGRKDHQVKIRGHRIELGEIENTLLKLPSIKDAAVITRKDPNGEPFIAAYYVSNTSLSSEEVKKHLSNMLPFYMIPSCLQQMEALPLTASGKINRKELPAPEMRMEGYAEPASALEKKLAEIWQEVLGKEKIGLTENFFELGGHSLKAVQVITRISKELKLKADLKTLFAYPTIESLQHRLGEMENSIYEPIPVLGESVYYQVSHAQKRLWTLANVEEAAYNMSGMLVYNGKLDIEVLRKAFGTIVDRHEILRTTFTTAGGEVKQIVHAASAISFEVSYYDYSNELLKTKLTEHIIESASLERFDLLKGPLFRVKVIKEEAEKFLCLFSIHHIIFDGWSVYVLKEELEQLYNAYSSGKEASLLPLRVQYKDFAAWQNQRIASGEGTRDKAYWLGKLSGELPVLQLPVDYVREDRQIGKAGYFSFLIEETGTSGLKKISERVQGTAYMILVALVKVLLYNYSRQEDILIGSPVSGRTHKELEDQLGLYLNNLVLRDVIEEDKSFEQLLHKVKQTILEAFEHQLFPYNKLVEDLNLKKDKNRNFLYDVLVVMNVSGEANVDKGKKEGAFVLSGLKELNDNTSKVDLSFFFTEGKEISVNMEYRLDLFKQTTIERIAADLRKLVTLVVHDPGVTVARLVEGLTDGEKRRAQKEFQALTTEIVDEDF